MEQVHQNLSRENSKKLENNSHNSEKQSISELSSSKGFIFENPDGTVYQCNLYNFFFFII